MVKCNIIKTLVVVFVALGFSRCGLPDKDPNILLFLTDDLGYGDLACYGNEIINSPNIDKLASEGIRFTDFHSAGTVCSPSRASLLTGRHPYRLGFYYILGGGAHMQSSEITLPSMLRDHGYSTPSSSSPSRCSSLCT